jgi:tetratricopeptide (TPR) repeat protein
MSGCRRALIAGCFGLRSLRLASTHIFKRIGICCGGPILNKLQVWCRMHSPTRVHLALLLSVHGLASACLPAKAESLNRAANLFQQGRYEEAAVEYRRASTLDPSWAAPQLGLGNALRALGDRGSALLAYEKAVELAPDSPDAQVALAGLLLEARRWADSERQLRAAVTELPNDGRLHAMLGFALFQEGRRSEALCAFERSRQLCERCMTGDEAAVYDALKSHLR